MEKPIFKIFVGMNPFGGGPCYTPIFNNDVYETCGKNWEDLSKEDREEVINFFNN
jgi:hypothetical protein